MTPLKLSYINKFTHKAKDMNLVFVISPMWYKQDSLVFEPIKNMYGKTDTADKSFK